MGCTLRICDLFDKSGCYATNLVSYLASCVKFTPFQPLIRLIFKNITSVRGLRPLKPPFSLKMKTELGEMKGQTVKSL